MRINLKLQKFSTNVFKFRITLILIISAPTQITSIRIMPNQISLIQFPPTHQTMIQPTHVHYRRCFHGMGILWTHNPVLFLREHLHILTFHWYMHPLQYIHYIIIIQSLSTSHTNIYLFIKLLSITI